MESLSKCKEIFRIRVATVTDGKFYTEDGKDAWELVKEGISKDSSIATEFKGAANDYVRGLMDVIADKGWDNIPDIQMDIMYSGKNGLYVA